MPFLVPSSQISLCARTDVGKVAIGEEVCGKPDSSTLGFAFFGGNLGGIRVKIW